MGRAETQDREEISALPNANAADAFSPLPSVSLQRHQGEGSSVQVRGIDANLNNVTLNGAHLGGKSEHNPGGDRRVYMDGIPAGLVGAVQLNKTLTPDMDADPIGGMLAIETQRGCCARRSRPIQLRTEQPRAHAYFFRTIFS